MPVPLPIVESFGYPLGSPQELEARKTKLCPCTGKVCEKYRQYEMGYCSIRYTLQGDTSRVFAVCDQRLSGDPVRHVVGLHFGDDTDGVELVSEVVLNGPPRTSFDFAVWNKRRSGFCLIETQANATRGGSMAGVWEAAMSGASEVDRCSAGINMGNVFGLMHKQMEPKARFCHNRGIPLYLIMQDVAFTYLHNRVPFQESTSGPGMTFVTFDYTGQVGADGRLEFRPVRTFRTSVLEYLNAATEDPWANVSREAFIERVMKKGDMSCWDNPEQREGLLDGVRATGEGIALEDALEMMRG